MKPPRNWTAGSNVLGSIYQVPFWVPTFLPTAMSFEAEFERGFKGKLAKSKLAVLPEEKSNFPGRFGTQTISWKTACCQGNEADRSRKGEGRSLSDFFGTKSTGQVC